MPRRPMDSSCLWLPPVLAVLAAGAPGTDQWQAVCDRCPVFTSRKLGQPTLAHRIVRLLVSYTTLAPQTAVSSFCRRAGPIGCLRASWQRLMTP